MALNEAKLNEFLGKFVSDLGATMNAGMVLMGEKLGLYKAMAGAGPLSSAELAKRIGVMERYVREWLSAQAAGGYVVYDASTDRFELPPEQAFVLADETSPAYAPGAFEVAIAVLRDEPRVTEAFREGRGFGWHEHNEELFRGTERFFRPNYVSNLVSNWIPALNGVEARLKKGARVADVGCGLGTSTILMAQAYLRSTFIGYDYHAPSIDWAREAADRARVSDRVRFEVAKAKEYPGDDFEFVAFFDCLHDMGDPIGAASHVRKSMVPDGTWMIVEPFAHDKLESNLNPVGRVYFCASTMICTPASKAQEVGMALGAQAGESRLRQVVSGGGFRHFRRATETPFNLVFEARP